MDDQVDEVKRKSDIVGVISQYVTLKKTGRHHKGCCPFHGEKTPSFMVNEEMGMYKCFGCGKGGDVFSFLMEIEGIDFVEALKRLAEKVGVQLTFKRNEGEDEKQKLLEVMNLASEYYHYILTKHQEGKAALKYLHDRSICDKLIETFKIGYAMQSWDGLISYLVKKKGYKEEWLDRCGLVGRRTGGNGFYDKFRGRIMFPLQDPGGKVVGFSGRILPELAKEDEPKYMNSPETELYHKGRMLYGFFQAKQSIRQKKRAVVVEGMLDLVSSYGAGVGETVAVGGTALTNEQVEMLARLSEKVYLAMDADEAGISAMKRSVEVAEKRGVGVKVVKIEGGKDPDEIARKSPGIWKKMVEEAVDVYDFVMDNSLTKYGTASAEAIKSITEDVIPFLGKVENNVVREVWAKRLAEKLGVAKEGVMAEIDRVRSGRREFVSIKKETGTKEEESKFSRLVKKMIGTLLYFPEGCPQVKKIMDGLTLPGASGKLLVWVMNNGDKYDQEALLPEIPAELKEIAMIALEDQGEGEKIETKEVVLMGAELAREAIREMRKKLTIEMKNAETGNDEEKASKMFEELTELNNKEKKITEKLA